jgi:glucose/arabinose dehydrogenase
MLQAPNDGSRWFVVEQAGLVRVFANTSGVTTAADFADIRGSISAGGETGLLGMAFHPDFPTNPRVYLSYTQNDPNFGLVSRITEFQLSSAGTSLDVGSARILLTIAQPEGNHNGGGIAFGPDRYLYIGMGDGGGADDQHGTIGNGQRLSTLLGKMLRIDVDGTAPGFNYRIPAGNPFAGTALCGNGGASSANCPEIYAYGFRNPWRWSFDRQTGQLWVGDVGQGQREEVDRVDINGNYGWRCMEGSLPTGLPCGGLGASSPPVAEYSHSVGASITGGYVYRGSAVPALVGRYVFGDFITRKIFNIDSGTAPVLRVSSGVPVGFRISSFAEDVDGELYALDYAGGIYRIVP